MEILDCFFDPEKKPVQPKPRYFPRRQRYNSKSKKGRDDRDKNGNRDSESNANPPIEQQVVEQLENMKTDERLNLAENCVLERSLISDAR